MKKLIDLEKAFSDKERMELIWVDRGIKPVGEVKKASAEYKKLLESLGFYTEIYDNRLFYSRSPEQIQGLKAAIQNRDFRKEGLFWGFPSCCVEYFSKVKRQGSDPFGESLKEAKSRLKKDKDVPAYSLNYAVCPTCLSTRESASGKLEESMAEALKSEDYRLYEKFQYESNGKLAYMPTSEGDGIVLWDYTK